MFQKNASKFAMGLDYEMLCRIFFFHFLLDCIFCLCRTFHQALTSFFLKSVYIYIIQMYICMSVLLCRRSKFYPFWISLRILATRMAPWRVNESEMKWRRETGTSSINCSTARQEATLVTLVSIWETIGWILFSRY